MAINPEILILNTILERATQGPLNETDWEIFRAVQRPGTEYRPFGHEDGVTLKPPGNPSPKGKLAHQRGTL